MIDRELNSIADIYSESSWSVPPQVRQNRVRKGGLDPMWTSEDVFQPLGDGGWNLVLQLGHGPREKKWQAKDQQNSIIALNHPFSNTKLTRYEHRQVYVPRWLSPYVQLVNKCAFAHSFYTFGGDFEYNDKDGGISPIFDLYKPELNMLIWYQGTVIHNANKIKSEWKGKRGINPAGIITQSRGVPPGADRPKVDDESVWYTSIADRIEVQGHKLVESGAFGEYNKMDWLWTWSDKKEDWKSIEANPTGVGGAPSATWTANSVESLPRLVFGAKMDNKERYQHMKVHSTEKSFRLPNGVKPLGRVFAEQYEDEFIT